MTLLWFLAPCCRILWKSMMILCRMPKEVL